MRELYGHMVKFLDNGKNQFFGRFYSVVQTVLLFAIYFKQDGQSVGLELIGLFSLVLLVLMIIIGYFYSKLGLLQAELSSRTMETPQFMETLYNTRRILAKLDNPELSKRLD